MSDRAVVAVVDAQGVVLRMSGRLEGRHEEHVLFGAAEHVILRVDRQDGREGLADMESRRGFVGRDAIAGLATFVADGVMVEDLAADLGDAGHRAERESVRLQSFGVHAHEQGEVAAGRMSADEDLARVAAVCGDMLDRPGEGRGGIVDVGRVFDLRAEAIVRSHHGHPRSGEAGADLGAVFRVQVLAAVLQSAAVEPYIGRKTFGVGRQGQVELAAFLLIRRLRDDIVLVGDVAKRAEFAGLEAREGEDGQQADEAIHQAMSDWTIFPWTSVRRKSRPELRNVNSS